MSAQVPEQPTRTRGGLGVRLLIVLGGLLSLFLSLFLFPVGLALAAVNGVFAFLTSGVNRLLLGAFAFLGATAGITVWLFLTPASFVPA